MKRLFETAKEPATQRPAALGAESQARPNKIKCIPAEGNSGYVHYMFSPR